MCLIVLAINAHPNFPLVIAANRDEYFDRPTKPLHLWPNSPIMAGQDERLGGTWFGATTTGRLALVTNFRGPGENTPKPKSRGHLLTQFLAEDTPPLDFCTQIMPTRDDYAGFNLIVGTGCNLYYASNRSNEAPAPLDNGIHGLSNHLINTPWPKVTKTKRAMARALSQLKLSHTHNKATEHQLIETLFESLRSTEHAPMDQVPNTGIDPKLEHQLSSVFVSVAQLRYGTRCSSVFLRNRNGEQVFIERSWDLAGELIGEVRLG